MKSSEKNEINFDFTLATILESKLGFQFLDEEKMPILLKDITPVLSEIGNTS